MSPTPPARRCRSPPAGPPPAASALRPGSPCPASPATRAASGGRAPRASRGATTRPTPSPPPAWAGPARPTRPAWPGRWPPSGPGRTGWPRSARSAGGPLSTTPRAHTPTPPPPPPGGPRSARSGGSPSSTTPRRPTPTPPPAPWPRSRGSSGSPAAATRAWTSTTWSPGPSAGWSGWCWWGRRPRSSWPPSTGPASQGRWSGPPRSGRPSPSGSAWADRATPSCSPPPAPGRTSSPTTPSGARPSRPPWSAWPPGTAPARGVVTTVAGRDARGTPAAARPLLGAGSTYWLLLAVVYALLVIGLVLVLSASSVAALAKQGDSYAYFKRQLLWVASGVVVMVVVSRIDYRLWRRLGTPLLVMATAGLVYVLVHPAAVSAYGSTRWISVGGGLTVQPAEF